MNRIITTFLSLLIFSSVAVCQKKSARNNTAKKTSVVTATKNTGGFTASVDGKQFTAAITGGKGDFAKKGLSFLYRGKPVLQLVFASSTAPDNRKLTIAIFNFNGKTGVADKGSYEILFSGAASGDVNNPLMAGYKEGNGSLPVTLDITEYKEQSATEAVISGKIFGTLTAVTGSNVTIENGEFKNVKVMVYNEKY